MKILLSIKPEYAYKIFSGEKKFEYRKIIFKKNIKSVLVYATKPVGKIIGEFEIEDIIKGNPEQIWELTKEYSGIEKEKFNNYFLNKKNSFAIKIKNPKIYKKVKTLRDYNINSAPQSFCYINNR